MTVSHPKLSSSPASRAAIPWRQIAVFIVLTFSLTWLVILPLYFINDDTLFQALYVPLSLVMMWIPGLIAWLIVRRTRPKGHRAVMLGFRRHRPGRRMFGYLLLAFLFPLILGLVSLLLASWWGLFDADIETFAGLQQAFADAGVTGMPVGTILATQAINMLVASWLLNVLPALGEEIGWRGWLTPQLLPLGIVPTILITGVIWGVWHTPLLLLGHNYPQLPGWLSVIFMVVFCTVIGGILSWLSIRTNSVWPAALGHSTLNATAAMPLLFSATPSYDATHVGIAGTTGWIVTAVLLAVLVMTKSFRAAPAVQVTPAQAWPSDFPGQ